MTGQPNTGSAAPSGPAALRAALLVMLLAVACAIGLVAVCGPARAGARTATASAALTRSAMLRAAESQLGYTEAGHYCSRFGECDPWCALFLTWVWQHAGIPVPRYPFVGDVWEWAALHGAVMSRRATPVPGDAVFYGTGPSTVDTARHIGLVEAVYPGYLVTLEGDVLHGVRRMVVPIAHPESVGEAGPIWGYGSPLPTSGAPGAAVVDPELAAAPRAIPQRSGPGPVDRGERILARTVRALAPFQHLPYAGGGFRATPAGVNRSGQVLVRVVTARTLARAQAWWAAFVRRWGGSASAYAVHWITAPNPPTATIGPAIIGTATVGQTLSVQPANWTGPPRTVADKWLRCTDATPGSCAPIAGADAASYVVQGADGGMYLRVAEAAENASGTGGPLLSAAVGPVGAAPLS